MHDWWGIACTGGLSSAQPKDCGCGNFVCTGGLSSAHPKNCGYDLIFLGFCVMY